MQKRWEYPQEMRSLEEGTLTQSSKNPHPAFPLTRSENSRADNLSVPLVPYEATGNPPSPVESSSFRNPALAHRTQPAPLALTRTRTHTHAHPCPLPPLQQPQGKREGSLGAHTEPAATPSPRQEPLALLLLPPQHRDIGQENDPVPRQHHLKAPLPQPSHSISTLSGRPARC